MSGGTPPKLWDSGDSFYGCSNCDYSGSKVHSFASTNIVVDEIEFNVVRLDVGSGGDVLVGQRRGGES